MTGVYLADAGSERLKGNLLRAPWPIHFAASNIILKKTIMTLSLCLLLYGLVVCFANVSSI